jgi:hypothetical protein
VEESLLDAVSRADIAAFEGQSPSLASRYGAPRQDEM